MSTKITLHLKEHCIEGEAKKAFKSLTDKYLLEETEDKLIEAKIDLLSQFIERKDFLKLRGSDKRLSGEIESTVTIEKNGDDITLIIK